MGNEKMVFHSGGVVKPDTNGVSWPTHHLETARIKLKFWSGWLTAISCITLLISIIIGGVVYSELWRLWYLMPGAYGSFFGIIAGPLGICASNSKRLSTTKCLWTSHISLCVVTIIGSILGFSFGVIGLMDTAYRILGYGCR